MRSWQPAVKFSVVETRGPRYRRPAPPQQLLHDRRSQQQRQGHHRPCRGRAQQGRRRVVPTAKPVQRRVQALHGRSVQHRREEWRQRSPRARGRAAPSFNPAGIRARPGRAQANRGVPAKRRPIAKPYPSYAASRRRRPELDHVHGLLSLDRSPPRGIHENPAWTSLVVRSLAGPASGCCRPPIHATILLFRKPSQKDSVRKRSAPSRSGTSDSSVEVLAGNR